MNSGDAVTLLGQNDDTGFARVRDEKGRTAWIPQDQLSTQPSLRTRVPALEQQVQDLTQKLDTIDVSWNQRTADMQKKVGTSDGMINDLKEQNQALNDQFSTVQKKVNAAAVQLADKQRTIIIQWFMYAAVWLAWACCCPISFPSAKETTAGCTEPPPMDGTDKGNTGVARREL